jgi:pimeloyl-ACP methyl ester carboxylesterase
VLGHSRGGLLVAALALEHRELAKTVVIVDSGTLAPGDPRYLLGTFYEEIERRIPPGPPTRETVRMEPDANSYSTDHVTDDFVARYLEIARLAKTQEAQRWMKPLSDRIWTPSLLRNKEQSLRMIDARGIPAPTLVIWGFNDPSAPLPLGVSLFERIRARTPQAEFHVLNQAGHYCFRERPHEFNRLLRSFCLG